MRSSLQQSFRRPTTLITLLVTLVFLVGLGLRLFDLTDQPLGFYPVRQLQGAIIARGIYYRVLPSVDEMLRRQAVAYWHSIAVHEPLMMQSLVAGTYLLIGAETPWVAGIYSTLFWMIGGIALFALARRMLASQFEALDGPRSELVSSLCALLALAYYMVLPFSVVASRSFQPDPGMVMWMLLSAYALVRWSEGQSWKWGILAGAFSGMAILTKVVAIYPLAGAMIAVVFYSYGSRQIKALPLSMLRMLKSPKLWAMAFLALAPAAAFYLSRQERASSYLSAWTLSLSHLLLEPGFYLGWAKLVQSLLNPVVLLAALVGLLLFRGRNLALLLGLWLGYFAYGLFLPYQMVTHSYYHLQLVPLVALSMTPTMRLILVRLLKLERGLIPQIAFAALVLAGVVYYSWQTLGAFSREDYRNEPAYWQEIASRIPADGKTIALTQDYGFRLIYYGWRKANLWPNESQVEVRNLRGRSKEFAEFFAMQTRGQTYFLITDFNQLGKQPELEQFLYENFPIIDQGQGYIIFLLQQ